MNVIRVASNVPVKWIVDGADNCIIQLMEKTYLVQEAQKVVPTKIWILFVGTEGTDEVSEMIISEDSMPKGMIQQLEDDFMTVDQSSRKYNAVLLEEKPKTPSQILFDMIKSFNRRP